MCYSIIRAVCLGWLIGGGLMSAVAHAATEILSLNSTSLKEMTLESIPPRQCYFSKKPVDCARNQQKSWAPIKKWGLMLVH